MSISNYDLARHASMRIGRTISEGTIRNWKSFGILREADSGTQAAMIFALRDAGFELEEILQFRLRSNCEGNAKSSGGPTLGDRA